MTDLTDSEIEALLAPNPPRASEPGVPATPPAGTPTDLTDAEVEALLVKAASPRLGPRPRPKQNGPWRFFDNEMQCLFNHGGGTHNCRSSTYYKIQGVPMCSKHCIIKLNQMLIELGVTK